MTMFERSVSLIMSFLLVCSLIGYIPPSYASQGDNISQQSTEAPSSAAGDDPAANSSNDSDTKSAGKKNKKQSSENTGETEGDSIDNKHGTDDIVKKDSDSDESGNTEAENGENSSESDSNENENETADPGNGNGAVNENTSDDEGADGNGNESDGSDENADEGAENENSGEEEDETADEADYSAVWDGKRIIISNYGQLSLIGTDKTLTSTDNDADKVGKGDAVESDDAKITYSLDAAYLLANDIPLPSDEGWVLPDKFSGTFSTEGEAEEDPILYDEENDTIYIANPYQLAALVDDEREDLPVLSGDIDAETFGMGSLLYTDEGTEDQKPLTYGKGHSYVLSRFFSENTPELKAMAALAKSRGANSITNPDMVYGRDYFGQVSVEIDGQDYILVGTRQQLDAINNSALSSISTVYAYGPVYEVYQKRRTLGSWDASNITEERVKMIYPGDADLVDGVYDGEAEVDFSANVLYSGNNGILSSDTYHSLTNVLDIIGTDRTFYCTIDPDTGTWSIDARSDSSLAYSASGNYIVFRDIDMLTDTWGSWRPMMFTGNMYGAKADDASDVSTLWNANHSKILSDKSKKPAIENAQVVPETKTQLGTVRMELDAQTGAGFFGTITGNFNSSSITDSPASVNNILLRHGTVTNPAVKGEIDTSVVDTLLTGVGSGLGLLLDPVLKLLIGKDVGVRQMLTGLLQARQQDPTSLATGAFAGRLVGNATINDCAVEDYAVSAVRTEFEDNGKLVGYGGFVGYSEGVTRYDGLSNTLGAVGSALSMVLNIIPGVGLGDLITVLLDNALPLQDLIPTGYTQPAIDGCSVSNTTLSHGQQKIGVGGFIGNMVGTTITGSEVRSCDMDINAEVFGGGFAGSSRDAIIKGTLSGLGIDVAIALHPQSEIISSSIKGSDIDVYGGSCLGGFAGNMANSYAIEDTIDQHSTVDVAADGDYAGGFVGYAQLGTLFGMNNYLADSTDLLGTVKGLVTGLVGSGSDQSLLDLGGVASSGISGCVVNAPLTVSAGGKYAGGLVGRGNGAIITDSSPGCLRKLARYARQSDGEYVVALPVSGAGRSTKASRIISVEAGDSYAGGVAGYITSANVGGLLGDTAGIGQYIGFDVCDVIVSGDGYTVSTTNKCAGGAFGWAVGGTVLDTTASGLGHVEAADHAGGFVGATGPGDLASGDGLDLSLLGISLIKLDNLFSLASTIKVSYTRANVSGDGFTVAATGEPEEGSPYEYDAGGFAGEANSATMDDCHVSGLYEVTTSATSGSAGGFVGVSDAGGLAGLVDEGDTFTTLQVSQLVDAVPYLVPDYGGCDVSYSEGGHVEAYCAGGFAGDFQSGKVNEGTSEHGHIVSYDGTALYTVGIPDDPYSVRDISYVRGYAYGGGWGGKVYSGSLVSAGGGLSLLGGHASTGGISAQDLLGMASVYVPVIKYAGVQTAGLTVMAANNPGNVATDGAAGGFIGYGSGVQVSYSDVNKLKHGDVSEPAELENPSGASYMDFEESPTATPYAVSGAKYAGGYIGWMDIGSAASLGGGLQLLGNSISLGNVLSALNTVSSMVEHSDVKCAAGGASILASSHAALGDGRYDDAGIGYAGGFAGKISGGKIQDSNVELFAYVIGECAAGGYAGEAEPGDVAHILDNGTIGLLGAVNNAASLIQGFVPEIRNSKTTCIPCGGAVRAQCESDGTANNVGDVLRGMAGGYIGHAVGTQITGNDDSEWEDENENGAYTGPTRTCAAVRIRSVYGAEYAGGYAGLMECGSTASTGGLSLLGGLISANNLLGALKAVYPVFDECSVSGPLDSVSESMWNAWKTYVGEYGALSSELKNASYADLDDFIYGYHAVAGRDTYDSYQTTSLSGCAGGFVGAMHSGSIHNSRAKDAKLVSAMRSAGGFAGDMETKGLSEFGSVSLFGSALNLNVGNLVDVADVFVPAISSSGTVGYSKGLTVKATASSSQNGCGNAGGYVGTGYGMQLGLEDSAGTSGVYIEKLKDVQGRNAIGGFAGRVSAASVLNADTSSASSGFLQTALDSLISTPTQLADVLNATISTIKFARVSPADSRWGYTVGGDYREMSGNEAYADFAGGFAGSLEAAVIGERSNSEDVITATGLRSVVGGYYAGGFFGIADVGSVAQVGGDAGNGSTTQLLQLVQAGNVSILDIFRTYMYRCEVSGVSDGIRVYAYRDSYSGTMGTFNMSGAAGGFGGGLMNGHASDSKVSNLNGVVGTRYSGGFIGHAGKNGAVGVDQAKVEDSSVLGTVLSALGLDLGANAQLLNINGSTISGCQVSGIPDGFVTASISPMSPIQDVVDTADLPGTSTGGFIGYADLAHVEDCSAVKYKKGESPQIAGGFAGRSSVAYLADVDASSDLTGVVVQIVNLLVKALYLDEASRLDLINLDGGILGLKLLADGDVLSVNLVGLKIAVSLVHDDPEYGGDDAALITIGSSTIKLPCDENGLKGETPDVSVSLIEGNRTALKNCSVEGVPTGYDILGGGSTYDDDATDELGYAGGFIGFNDSGLIEDSSTAACDTVKGYADKTGQFVGATDTRSRTRAYLEGTNNTFNIYRSDASAYDKVVLQSSATSDAVSETLGGVEYNRYPMTHLVETSSLADLDGAVQSGSGGTTPLLAFVSSGEAKLMDGSPQPDNLLGNIPAPADLKDPCSEFFNLTISKIWDDLADISHARPLAVHVYVTQVDAGLEPPSSLIVAGTPSSAATAGETYVFELDATHSQSPITAAWQRTVEQLPIAYLSEVAAQEPGETQNEIRYWQYFVHEVTVSKYDTSYSITPETASVDITNTYNEWLLPYLGGSPVMMVAPFLLFVIALMSNSMRMAKNPVIRRRFSGGGMRLEE